MWRRHEVDLLRTYGVDLRARIPHKVDDLEVGVFLEVRLHIHHRNTYCFNDPEL